MARPQVTLVADDPRPLRDRWVMAPEDEPGLTLRELLADLPALSTEPLTDAHLDAPVTELRLRVVTPTAGQAVYWPPGLRIKGSSPGEDGAGGDAVEPGGPAAGSAETAGAGTDAGTDGDAVAADPGRHPEAISDHDAVVLAHRLDIDRAASYLESGLSILVGCEKLLVGHLSSEIAAQSGLRVTTIGPTGGSQAASPAPGLGVAGLSPSRRNEQLDAMLAAISKARPGELVVVPNLDLLAGSTDAALSGEARELADAVYEARDCVMLGFIDPSLSLPEVLASRFATRVDVDILPRQVAVRGVAVPVGRALVTREEAGLFRGFEAEALYKHVAGLNAVRLRHALRFAYLQHRPPAGGPDPSRRQPEFDDLVAELRSFKVKNSPSFEIPRVRFDDIGGYDDVKRELRSAIAIINNSGRLPTRLRSELVPRGFIFEGPPGTGKTLFAKAAAAELGGTILVVSGPEITDKYVGESERKIRELFAEARRNAPSVVVFDEFDSIASRRTGNDDGGSRAGNAIVAQLLTELDGFRSEVPVLIIGTTNRVDLIDDALLRPSRFRPVQIGLPERDACRKIAEVHAKGFFLEDEDDTLPFPDAVLDALATAAVGLSGDEIRSVFRDARAGELVQGIPATPRRLGELLGHVRRDRQLRATARQRPGEARGGPRRSLRDRPGSVAFRPDGDVTVVLDATERGVEIRDVRVAGVTRDGTPDGAPDGSEHDVLHGSQEGTTVP
jgi:transitional endoplasmic reticulum ATPase